MSRVRMVDGGRTMPTMSTTEPTEAEWQDFLASERAKARDRISYLLVGGLIGVVLGSLAWIGGLADGTDGLAALGALVAAASSLCLTVGLIATAVSLAIRATRTE